MSKECCWGIWAAFRHFGSNRTCFESPPASYRSPSGPPGPKSPKSLPAPGSRKVWKKSRKSPKSLEKVSKMSVRDFFQTFWDPGAGGPERLFSDFLGISGPRDSCSSSEGLQDLWTCLEIIFGAFEFCVLHVACSPFV